MKHTLTLLILIMGMSPFFAQPIALTKSMLKPVSVEISEAIYKGKKGVRLVGAKDTNHYDEIAIIKNSDFINGTIEVELSGDRLKGSDSTYRGFVGIAFRVKESNGFHQYE